MGQQTGQQAEQNTEQHTGQHTAPVYELCFAIKDTGIGIAADHINKLFTPFYQADSSVRRRHDGTGLGLAISKQLVEQMGGQIWVESELGTGSTFFFTITGQIPLATPPIKTAASSSNQYNIASQHPLRILLAEDNVINQKVARMMLKKCGYTIDIVANGLEAISALQQQTYDVILMDIQMPEMDGVTATQHIRTDWLPEQQPVIIALTANAMDHQREEYLAAGMDDFVAKPLRMLALTTALLHVKPIKPS
ncbi:MAG: response regulator [Chloroflexota bacterium]